MEAVPDLHLLASRGARHCLFLLSRSEFPFPHCLHSRIYEELLTFHSSQTAGRSIEELSEVFNDPHPVKASLKSPLTKTHSSGS